MVKISPMWKILPIYSWSFPPAKITRLTVCSFYKSFMFFYPYASMRIIESITTLLKGLIESNTPLREGRGNPIQDLQSTTRLAESWMLQILDTRMGFPSPSLNVVFDYFSHSCPKMCKICLKHTRRDFSRLFGVDVLWRHRWTTSGMGLSHPPG